MSVADLIAKCVAGEALTVEEHASLVAAVDSEQTPVNVRVRALPYIATPAELPVALLKKLYATIGKLLEEELPAVHNAVIQAISGLAETAVKTMEAAKSAEVVRDLADILVQISLENSGFVAEVRKTAKDALLDKLALVSMFGVATKAFHLLSTDRWNDTPEQLEAERKAALELFHNLATQEKYKEMWTEEVEVKMMKFVGAISSVLTSGEMSRFLSSLGRVPTIAAKQGAPLVDLVLKLKLDTPRGIESVVKLSSCIPKDAVVDAIADKLLPILAKQSGTDALSVQVARATTFAANHASAERAAKIISGCAAALVKDKGFSFTYTEALLQAIAISLPKAPEAATELFADAAFLASAVAKAEAATKAELSLTFAVKKAVAAKTAVPKHAEAIECLKHVARLGAFLSEKKNPAIETPSWLSRKQLPKAPAAKRVPAVELDAPLQQKKTQPAPKRK